MAFINVTWAALRTQLQERLDSSQHWVDAELLIKFNDTLKFWNLLTGQWRTTVTASYNHPSSDAYIFLPGTMIWPMRMELADGTPVEKVSFASLHLAIPGWPAHTTADGGAVPTTVKFWAPRSLQLATLYPRPVVTTPVTVDGIMDTPVLAADGDFLDLDEGLHEDLLDLAAHWAQFKDGGPKFYQSVPALQKIVLRAGDINEEIRATDVYRKAQGQDRDRDHYPRVQPLGSESDVFREVGERVTRAVQSVRRP